MDAHPASHPTDQTLSSFGLGKLDDGSAVAVNKHLDGCPECRHRVSELSADSFLDRVRAGQKSAGNSTIGRSVPGEAQRQKATNAPAPPAASTLPPGLADHPDYEIKRELGRGGMGVVYLAQNTLMGRDEVLKVMGRYILERPGVLERFVREIRVVAKLRHPNIVTAYHATRVGESIVFAMEYVEGLDLSKMVKAKGPLPVAHACNFVYQAALGLQHAHEEGLVHRDIKPGNLMLSRKGDKSTIKVLDFGLAKATREEKTDNALTSEGQALGTPDFIAPEQILDAQSADIRADIYSLGSTLYYLLTGRPPFQASSLYDMYQAHISRDAELLNFVRPEVPAELAALVAKMMAKEPVRRFQTPNEVAQALSPFFKKASVAFRQATAELDRAGPTSATGSGIEVDDTPVAPAPSSKVAAPRPKRGAAPTGPLGPWEDLIANNAVESSLASEPAGRLTQGRRLVWTAVVAGVLVVAFAAAWLGGILRVNPPQGVIVVTNVPKDAEIRVDGEIIPFAWPGGSKPLEIRAVPGQHRVEVKSTGFETQGELVTVRPGESAAMTVHLEPLRAGLPAANGQDAEEVPRARNHEAWKLATATDASERDGVRAVELATTVCEQDKFNSAHFLDTLAAAHAETGKFDAAVKWQTKAIERSAADSDSADFRARLELYKRKKPYHQGDDLSVSSTRVADADEDPQVLNVRAWKLATATDAGVRDGVRAVELATRACEKNGFGSPHFLDTLAAAHAEAGDFAAAVKWQTKAIERSAADSDSAAFRARLELYKRKKPYHQGDALPASAGIPGNTGSSPSTPANRIAALNGGGKWRIERDELVQSDPERLTNCVFGDKDWTDYTFSTEVKVEKCFDCVSLNFRQGRGDGPNDGLYFSSAFLAGGDRGGIARWINKQFRVLSNRRARNAWLTVGTWHTMSIVVRGSHFDAYLDGKLTSSEHDDARSKGIVGFRVSKTVCRFRNIKVIAPDGSVLWKGLPELPTAGAGG